MERATFSEAAVWEVWSLWAAAPRAGDGGFARAGDGGLLPPAPPEPLRLGDCAGEGMRRPNAMLKEGSLPEATRFRPLDVVSGGARCVAATRVE